MKRRHILTTPTRTSDLSFDELHEEFSQDWPDKARKLQIRRWRALKRDMKGEK